LKDENKICYQPAHEKKSLRQLHGMPSPAVSITVPRLSDNFKHGGASYMVSTC
jgi:hypothetical protein